MAATSRAVLADQAATADPAALLSLEAASREVPVAHPDALATKALVAAGDLVVGASMDPAEVAVGVPSDVAADPAVGVIAVETAAETAIMMLSMRTCFSIGTRLASKISVRIIVNFIEFR